MPQDVPIRAIPDPDIIYKLLGAIFDGSGMRLSLISTDGTPAGDGDVGFCRYIQASEYATEPCHDCTRRAVASVKHSRRPYSYRCHMGLCSTIIPIVADQNEPLAYLLFSGYRMEPEEMERLPAPLPIADVAREAPALYATFGSNPFFSRERQQEVISLLATTANYLAQVSAHNQMLTEIQLKSVELLTSANMQEQRKKKDNQAKLRILASRMHDDFLFNAMERACLMAQEEHAPKTEALIHDIAIHTRKAYTAAKPSALGQDLEDLDNFLHLLRVMHEGRFRFDVEIGRECDPELRVVQIPFATMVELTLNGPISQMEQGGVVTISVHQREHFLEVSVADNSEGYSRQVVNQINRLHFPEDDESGFTLCSLIGELRAIYGSSFRWRLVSIPNVRTSLTLYLPIGEPGGEPL